LKQNAECENNHLKDAINDLNLQLQNQIKESFTHNTKVKMLEEQNKE